MRKRRTEHTAKYHIRSLTPDQQQRSSDEWHRTQARFVDDPPAWTEPHAGRP